jgi:hypothetical protein
MERKLETMLPGLPASAYDRVRGAQATAMDQLRGDWEIARDEESPIKANRFFGEGFMEAYRTLYETVAKEYIEAGPDRDTCLKGIDHVDRYVKGLPLGDAASAWGTTWGDYCQFDHADEIRAHWELQGKRKWPGKKDRILMSADLRAAMKRKGHGQKEAAAAIGCPDDRQIRRFLERIPADTDYEQILRKYCYED